MLQKLNDNFTLDIDLLTATNHCTQRIETPKWKLFLSIYYQCIRLNRQIVNNTLMVNGTTVECSSFHYIIQSLRLQ